MTLVVPLSMAEGEAAGALGLLVVFLIIVFYSLVFALSIGGFVLWIWMLIDVATRPEWQFPNVRPGGSAKIVWIMDSRSRHRGSDRSPRLLLRRAAEDG